MNTKTQNGQLKQRARRKHAEADWERRRRIKEYFDSLSPEAHERELKKLSGDELFFLVTDTLREEYKQGRNLV